MKVDLAKLPTDLQDLVIVAEKAFLDTPDSSIENWFSFKEMSKYVEQERGVCLKAISDSGDIVGILYAQQENPINGREGLEKWVIVLAAVIPEESGKGVGSLLLKEMERKVAEKNAKKMFVYTNDEDDRVIKFYLDNGYKNAGSIKDYQYGSDNSAIFLLKYL